MVQVLYWLKKLEPFQWICFRNQTYEKKRKGNPNLPCLLKESLNKVYIDNCIRFVKCIWKSTESRIIESVCNIVLFVIAADCFSPIIAS